MRKYYIDNLRWITIMLLVPYHAAMAWNIWAEPNYVYFEGNRLVSSIIVFLSPYYMPLLFLLAGMSTGYALQKRTIGQYVLERFKKLLIPFVFGTLLLMPVMTYIADKFNCGYKGSFIRHYHIFFTKFTDLTGADGGFSLGQFWFVLYLFFISLVGAAIIILQKKLMLKLKKEERYMLKSERGKKELRFWALCLLGLPLPFLSELLSVGGKSFAEYTYLFLIGYSIFSDDNVVNKLEKCRWAFFSAGLAGTILNVYLFIWSPVDYPIVNTAAKFVSEWFMMLALIGLGERYLNFNGKVSGYLSQRSFAFYIFHFIWVVWFQYLLVGICDDNTVLLYILPVVFAYGATLLCCELCGRIPVFCYLMGIKPFSKSSGRNYKKL